jgi:hypothetical protein
VQQSLPCTSQAKKHGKSDGHVADDQHNKRNPQPAAFLALLHTYIELAVENLTYCTTLLCQAQGNPDR